MGDANTYRPENVDNKGVAAGVPAIDIPSLSLPVDIHSQLQFRL